MVRGIVLYSAEHDMLVAFQFIGEKGGAFNCSDEDEWKLTDVLILGKGLIFFTDWIYLGEL